MPVSIPYVFTNGTVAEAAEVNSNFTAVKNFADGLATGVNLDDGAVVAAKIGTNAVTTIKIDAAAVTAVKLASDVASSDQIVLGGQVFG
jgi:hypothetical protein